MIPTRSTVVSTDAGLHQQPRALANAAGRFGQLDRGNDGAYRTVELPGLGHFRTEPRRQRFGGYAFRPSRKLDRRPGTPRTDCVFDHGATDPIALAGSRRTIIRRRRPPHSHQRAVRLSPIPFPDARSPVVDSRRVASRSRSIDTRPLRASPSRQPRRTSWSDSERAAPTSGVATNRPPEHADPVAELRIEPMPQRSVPLVVRAGHRHGPPGEQRVHCARGRRPHRLRELEREAPASSRSPGPTSACR